RRLLRVGHARRQNGVGHQESHRCQGGALAADAASGDRHRGGAEGLGAAQGVRGETAGGQAQGFQAGDSDQGHRVTARFDRAALALDVRQTTGAYGDIMALMKKVSGYTHRMGELNLDAVPVHGARIDPFYRLPGLRQSLLTAQGHTGAWGRVSNDLFMQLIQGAIMFGPMLTNASGEIGKIISAAESAG